MAADGQATAGNGAMLTRTPAEKLGILHGRLAFGAAGSAGLRQRVVENLEQRIAPQDCARPISELRGLLHAAVNEVQHQSAAEYVRRSFAGAPDGIATLFSGVSDDGAPWIYEITEDGEDEVHHKAEAIGSGRPYARYALMTAGHYRLRRRNLRSVRVLAYRALDDAIRTDATVLGEPIALMEVTRGGAREIRGAEMDGVRAAVVTWQAHEREVFEKLDVEDAVPADPSRWDVPGIDAGSASDLAAEVEANGGSE